MDELDEWLLCLDFAFSLRDFIAGTILCIGVVLKLKRSVMKEDLVKFDVELNSACLIDENKYLRKWV